MRTAVPSAAALISLAPSTAAAAPHLSPDLIPRLVLRAGGPLDPSVGLAIRRGGSPQDAAVAPPDVRLYRVVPELSVTLRPAEGVEVFAGAGVGPAFAIPPAGLPRWSDTDLAFSATLGARVPWLCVPLTAAARAEVVVGQGAAVMIRLTLDPPPSAR